MADCRKRNGEYPGGAVLDEDERKESRNKRTKTNKEPVKGSETSSQARGEKSTEPDEYILTEEQQKGGKFSSEYGDVLATARCGALKCEDIMC
jgi:hypothetical protein